jgi:hypothetical protein
VVVGTFEWLEMSLPNRLPLFTCRFFRTRRLLI